MKRLMILALAGLFVFSACSGGDDGPDPIIGSWDTGCRSDGDGGYERAVYNILGDSMDFNHWSYSSSDCSDGSMLTVFFGDGSIAQAGQASATLSGATVKATRIDTTFTNFKARLITQEFADVFNLISFCGKTDWAPAVDVNILACMIPVNPVKGLIYTEKSGGTDMMYFDDEDSAPDPDGYPTVLDPTPYKRN